MDLRDDLTTLVPGGGNPAAEVKVIVDLNVRKPAQELLSRLAEAGFELRSTIGNKLLGSVPAGNLEQLRADGDVRHVEVESRLSRHRG